MISKNNNIDPAKDHFEQIAGMLYSNLSDSKNLVFSPASILIALAMTAAGSSGKTLATFSQFFHFNEDVSSLLQTVNQLQSGLANNSEGVQTMFANKIFVGIPEVKPQFSSFITQYFAGSFEKANFSANPDQVREDINIWVASQTNSLITNLLQPGSIQNMTKMVLVNAIYFKGLWLNKFDKNFTKKQPFFLDYEDKGKQVPVDMMMIENKFDFFENESLAFIQIPYQGNQYVMEVLLPKDIFSFDKINVVDRLNIAREKKSNKKVILMLPKFKIESKSFSLVQILSKLGLAQLFSSSADFSAMDPDNQIYVSDVIHKAVIEVNEEGTEAAAATAVIMRKRSKLVQSQPVQIICNRPFIYTIRHQPSQTTLFLGKFTMPS